MNTALEYSTRVVQEGGRRCKNNLVHLTPLRIPLMNPPCGCERTGVKINGNKKLLDRTCVLFLDRLKIHSLEDMIQVILHTYLTDATAKNFLFHVFPKKI
jgi:hypothetical protein